MNKTLANHLISENEQLETFRGIAGENNSPPFLQPEPIQKPQSAFENKSNSYLSLDTCKKLLGRNANSLSDEDLVELRTELYSLSEILIDKYLEERNKQDDCQRETKN